MNNGFSARRLAENEVIFREANRSVKEFVEDVQNNNSLLNFYCECSHIDCREHITLSTQRYDESHKNERQFIVLKGHEIPEIERIVQKEDTFNVVEKYGELPTTEEVHAALKNI